MLSKSPNIDNNSITKLQLIFIGLITSFFLFRCGGKSGWSNEQFEYYNLDTIARSLNSLDCTLINCVSTKKGFNSILKWSDSIRQKSFVKDISRDLKDKRVFNITKHKDSLVVLSLGSSDEVLGATSGYLFLKRKNEIWKIDKYRGGK